MVQHHIPNTSKSLCKSRLGTEYPSFNRLEPSDFYNIGLGSTSILTHDFDGDGIKDITVAREDLSDNSFEIWKGNSDGTYTPHYSSPVWTENELQFREFRIFDVNNDGFPDLVLRPFHYGGLSTETVLIVGMLNSVMGLN